MATSQEEAGGSLRGIKSRSPREEALRRFLASKSALVGLAIFLIMILVAILAPVLARYNPDIQFRNGLTATGSPLPPSGRFWLGTDPLGRDLYSRLVYGARTSMEVAILANIISTIIGVVIGAVAGFFGGIVDTLLMRFTDVMMSFPVLLFAAFLSVALKPGLKVVIFVIGFVSWFYLARIVRGEILSVKNRDYVDAARSIGVSRFRILIRHLLPQVYGQIIVYVTLGFSTTVLYEAILSFLGIGVQPPTPSWGNLISDGDQYLTSAPWIAVFPGIAVAITVLGLNLLGDGLRDALDPRK
ncbi:MAG: ABC transporter permease [Rubrobacteraceae bacterium]|uniref:ABC transporter permease n=1 Tax=Rubrobacter naiadicus TaxID=1392641 RepID=UPI00235FEE95|nr:ABC transporter permease [Rubrobacter naiadicus]MCL6439480.1 ABC transporter permease [Rubrobacteraceae bacterium]